MPSTNNMLTYLHPNDNMSPLNSPNSVYQHDFFQIHPSGSRTQVITGTEHSNNDLSVGAHTPKAAQITASYKPKKSHLCSVSSGSSNVIHGTARPENMFNNTDPHTVHTEQSNAMPNHGRNVHEEFVLPIARYYPYPSVAATEAHHNNGICNHKHTNSKEHSSASFHNNSYSNLAGMDIVPSPTDRHHSPDEIISPSGCNMRDMNLCAFSSISECTNATFADTHNLVNHAHEIDNNHSTHHSTLHSNQLHYRHDPYATRHILRASCLPFERIEHAKSDLQAVISAVCGENFNAVVESVQKATKGHCLEVAVRTSQPRVFADLMAEAVVLMDRKGFYVAHHIESPKVGEKNTILGALHSQGSIFSTRQAVLDYCEHVRNLPQQERHWRLDGLPCSSAGFRLDGFDVKHGNNRGDKNYRQAHLARSQRRLFVDKRAL